MTVFVALLRGVNVGGRSKLPMAQLRQTAADCGFGAVQTYIQSGNLVLTSDRRPAAVAELLASAIVTEGGLRPRVAVRSHDELAALAAGNPYLARSTEPKQLHVAFLAGGTEPVLPAEPELARFAPEELTVAGRDTYFFLPNGLGRSKLAEAFSRRTADATWRNWRTVLALLKLADDTAND